MSEMSPNDPLAILRRVAETGMGIRFGRGVVAKTGYAVICVLVVWAIVVLRLGPSVTQDCFLIGAAVAATVIGGWWIRETFKFAKENPAQALLEGTEFIE